MTQLGGETHTLGPLRAALLALMAALMFLPGFFTLPPVDRDEARFAQATRQMIETGDFVDIRFQQEARHKKPVGIYWLQAASVSVWQRVTGSSEINVIWPYRVPSFVAAVLAVVLTGMIGAALFGRGTGFIAGLLFLPGVVLNVEARLATTDAVLLACILAVQLTLVRAFLPQSSGDGAPVPPPPRALVIAGWMALGLAILVKGPIIGIVIGGTLLGLAIQRRPLRFLRTLQPGLGLAIVALIVVPWLVAITLKSDGTFLQESVGRDLLGKVLDGQTAGRSPPGVHVLLLWIGMWPASLIVMLAIPWVGANRRSPEVSFLLAWIVPAWIVFELPLSKLFHYVLPLYPALAILAAAWLMRAVQSSWPAWMWRLTAATWAVATIVLALAVALVPFLATGAFDGASIGLAVVSLGALAALPLLVRGRVHAAVAVMACAGFVFWHGVSVSLGVAQAAHLSRSIAAAVPQTAPPCTRLRLAGTGYEEPSLVFMTETRSRFLSARSAADVVADEPCTVVYVEGREEPAFQARLKERGTSALVLKRIEGINYTNSKRMTVTLYRKAAP